MSAFKEVTPIGDKIRKFSEETFFNASWWLINEAVGQGNIDESNNNISKGVQSI